MGRLKDIEPLNIKPVKSATSRLNINLIHTIAGSRGVCSLLWASTHILCTLFDSTLQVNIILGTKCDELSNNYLTNKHLVMGMHH